MKIGLVSFLMYAPAKSENEKYKKTMDLYKGLGVKKIDEVIKIINQNEDLDIIVFPGWSISTKEDLDTLSKEVKNKKTACFLELWFGGGEKERSQHRGIALINGKIKDREIYQYFATNADARDDKKRAHTLEELQAKRLFHLKNNLNVNWLFCGENNILKLKGNKNDSNCVEPLDQAFCEIKNKTSFFINPAHDQFGQAWKVERKIEYLSRNNKISCFVTNLNLAKPLASSPKKEVPILKDIKSVSVSSEYFEKDKPVTPTQRENLSFLYFNGNKQIEYGKKYGKSYFMKCYKLKFKHTTF